MKACELTFNCKISPKAATLIFLLRSPAATAVVLRISLAWTQRIVHVHFGDTSNLGR